MSDVVIRYVEECDLDLLVILCEEHARYENVPYQVNGKSKSLAKYIFKAEPDLYCLVVVVDENVVGYATYMRQFSTWDACFYLYMDCLFLREEMRGFGLGERIVERIKVEAEKLNCNLIQWQTPDFNVPAIKFYRHLNAIPENKVRFFLETR